MGKYLILLMSAEAFMAATFYLTHKDWKHAFYWLSVACINVSASLL